MTDILADIENAPTELTSEKYVLRLCVANNTPQSTRAIERTKPFCESHIKGRYELAVVDLYQQRRSKTNRSSRRRRWSGSSRRRFANSSATCRTLAAYCWR